MHHAYASLFVRQMRPPHTFLPTKPTGSRPQLGARDLASSCDGQASANVSDLELKST